MDSMPPVYSHLDAGRGPVIANAHVENQDLPLVDRLIEPQTIAHFLSSCASGTLPNGEKTSLPLLKEDEYPLVGTPSAANGGRPIIECVMSRIGSIEDGSRMTIVGRNIWSMKNRAWAGIVPLSEQRWVERGLDKPENFDVAAQCFSAVIAAFEYLCRDRVASNLRETFNLISEHWGEFEAVVNAARARQHGELEQLDMRALWTEYMAAHFEVMVERAHRWVIVHVNALRVPLIEELGRYRTSNMHELDSVQWRITDRLHTLTEIVAVADYTILIPMHGYHGYTAPPVPAGALPALRSPDYKVRRKAYSPYLKTVSRIADAQRIVDRMGTGNGERRGIADPVSLCETTRMQIECQDKVRKEVRDEPVEPVPREPWILDMLQRIEARGQDFKGHGFVVYRLTYGQTEAEWTAFREKLDAHIVDWGRGQTGSASIKQHLKLHWRDGKALGIAEGDIGAAMKHYMDTYDGSDLPFTLVENVNKQAFLAVDAASYASYTTSAYTPATDYVLQGDFTGFVLAVDPEYDPNEGASRPDEIPGWFGQMRILGSLVWGDLYAMLASQSSIIEDLWPLALDHPNQVYAGIPVPLVVKSWRIQNGVRGVMMREMTEYAKATIEGRPWPVPGTESVPQPTTNTTPEPNINSNTTDRTVPEPQGPVSPDQHATNIWLLFRFVAWLRSNGRTRQAILVEQMMRAPHGEVPDINEVYRRMELEGVRVDEFDPPLPPGLGRVDRGRGRGSGQGQGREEDQCPMQ